ncbi:MAG TPA: FtsX-like permease family protein [Candidatus Atribacteria bacterium]|nr:FtsX-like permease family protein [Candidatus Atribacteria bacterium]
MILQSLKIALESLWANKMRSILSMLGIIIGVGAVIAIVSVGTGSTQQVTSRIANLGSNMITIYPRTPRGQGGMIMNVSSQDKFSLELSDYIDKFCPSVIKVIPVKQISGRLISNDINVSANILGTNINYAKVNNYEINTGNFISENDDKERRQVMVLGSQLAEDLFEDDDPIGKRIKVSYNAQIYLFDVIGVMKEKGGSMGGDLDDRAYIPISVAMKKLTNSNFVTNYIAQAASSEKAATAVSELENFMVKFLDDEEQEQFRIISQDEILDTVSSVTETMSIMLGGIAAISLLVGGIGIMNIMLVSVTERTREIGVRKALGARNAHILFQFLMESLNLSSFGGILGIGFGWIAAYFLSQYGNWPMVIAPLSVGLAFGFALFIGIFFGLYPAMKAAKMNPVDALRYE